MHIHPHTDEGFYVGEGELTFLFPGERWSLARARSSSSRAASSTPRGSRSPLRGLLIYSPGDAKHITQPI
jgi:hypothetical protein